MGFDNNWNLKDIYETKKDWELECEALELKLNENQKYIGKLNISSKNLANCLNWYEETLVLFEKIYGYASLNNFRSSLDSISQELMSKISLIENEVNTATAFIEPEILNIDENILKDYINSNAKLEKYRVYIDEIIRFKPHILNKNEEELLGLVASVATSPARIYNTFVNSDIKYPDILDKIGNKHKLSATNYISYMVSEDEVLRKNAFFGIYNTLKTYENTFFSMISGNINKVMLYKNSRKYNSSLSKAMFADNLPVEIYENVISEVNKKLPILYKYYGIKKKLLNLEKFHIYDVYTKLPYDLDIDATYDNAKNVVKEALLPLGEEYIVLVDMVFNNSWIDVYENTGKRSGACVLNIYSVHPYMLLNHTNKFNDITVIAHEMGHAIHSYKSSKKQSYLNSNYKIFIAEIVSTVNECLLSEYLINTSKTKEEKIIYLTDYIEKIKSTIFRQTMFAEFEKIIYEKVENKEVLSTKILNEVYYDLNKKYFGENVELNQEIEIEWARIPHFYNEYYVYKYASGMCAALNIVSSILSGDKEVLKEYLLLLEKGCSEYPLELLQKVKVDFNTSKPFEMALNMFEAKVDELEKLI